MAPVELPIKEQLFEKYDDDPDKGKEKEVAFHYSKLPAKEGRGEKIMVYWNSKYGPLTNSLSNLQKRNSAKIPMLVKRYKTFLMCVAYLQIDQDQKTDKAKIENDPKSLDYKIAAESRFKKSAATSSLLLAKSEVLEKNET